MFTRSMTDKRRVIIVDASHLFYKYAFGGASQLSAVIEVDGVNQLVDTTLPTYFIKQIHRWSNFGTFPTVICFDGAGCSKSRKAYFTQYVNIRDDAQPVDYKEGRQVQDNRFYTGINITQNLLMQAGVVCLRADGYEADDLIKAAIDKAKLQYPDLPIDVITGDADLIPLVDDQVSVFISSRKSTWAEDKSIEKNHYFQLTPQNYQSYVEDLSSYRKLIIPYNSILLAKLLRGDKSDAVPAYPKFTPTKYNNLVESMINDEVDFSDLFRYETPEKQLCYLSTKEPIPEELIASTPTENKYIKFLEPKCLTKMCDVLSNYLDDDIIKHIKFVYNGINLNGVFTGLPETFCRKPVTLTSNITGYSASTLQQIVSVVKINIPI